MTAETKGPEVQGVFLHDVFISYSRRDKDFARKLTDALRNYQPPRDLDVPQRRLNVFRDEEDFTGAEYHAAVAKHLKNSNRLILLCSPASRQSEYVNGEVRQFGEFRGADNIIPILIQGLPNNEAPPDRKEEMAFPEALCHILQMPLAIDYRGFNVKKDKVDRGVHSPPWFAILGAIYGTSRDAIEQREKRREARRRRITRGIVAGVMTTLLAATVISLVFWRQAVEQRNIAVARQLAAQAELTRNQGPNLIERSTLLAVESLKRTPTLEADLVLRPQLGLLARPGAPFAADGEIFDVIVSRDRKYVAAATTKNVGVWELATGRPVATLPAVLPVAALAFSPDGTRLATGSGSIGGPRNYVAQFWDLSDGREVYRWPHEEPARLLNFSADGRRLVTGDDKNARVLNLADGKEIATLTHEAVLLLIALNPDGERLLTETNRKVNEVWNVDRKTRASEISIEPGMYNVAFSPDWKLMATASAEAITIKDVVSGDQVARIPEAGASKLRFLSDGAMLTASTSRSGTVIWEADGGAEIVRLPGGGELSDAAISPNGEYVATSNPEGNIAQIWTLDGREVSRLYEPFVKAAAFTADGRGLMTVSSLGQLRVWETTGSREAARLPHQGAVSAVVYTPDGERLVTNSDDRSLRVWDIASEKEVAQIKTEYGVRSLAVSPVSGERLAIAISDRDTRIFETLTGNLVARLDLTEGVDELLFSRDEKYLATAGLDNIARVWVVASAKEIAHMPHDDGIASIAMSPDGKYLATSTINSEMMFVWDAMTGREVSRVKERGSLASLAFSPSGQYLAAAAPEFEGGAVILWDPATGREVQRMPHEGALLLGFSPDGNLLATGGAETARVWTLKDGSAVARLLHRGEVTAVTFSADSARVMTGSVDGAARVWDAMTGQELSRMQAASPILAISVSPDGRYLATGSEDARTWFLQPADLVDEACRRLTRNLTRNEWSQFVADEPYAQTCPNLPAAP